MADMDKVTVNILIALLWVVVLPSHKLFFSDEEWKRTRSKVLYALVQITVILFLVSTIYWIEGRS